MPENGHFVQNMQHVLTAVYSLLWLTAGHASLVRFMSLEYIGNYIWLLVLTHHKMQLCFFIQKLTGQK